MDYEQFITEIRKYWNLRDRGLKKQANRFLFEFTGRFEADVSRNESDNILFQFCREYIDEGKFPDCNLPFQITELLSHYLIQECEKDKMPQMRWAFQIFGRHLNLHAPDCGQNPYNILERAYAHEQCDQQTVNLYFGEQVDCLWWGQHHFPEGCLIEQSEFEETVHTAKRVLAEKHVEPSLVTEFDYYVKLYGIYFEWKDNGRNGDFYQLCRNAGLEYKELPAFYYEN